MKSNTGLWFILAVVFALLCITLTFAAIINLFCLEFLPGLICMVLAVASGLLCHLSSRKI